MTRGSLVGVYLIGGGTGTLHGRTSDAFDVGDTRDPTKVLRHTQYTHAKDSESRNTPGPQGSGRGVLGKYHNPTLPTGRLKPCR